MTNGQWPLLFRSPFAHMRMCVCVCFPFQNKFKLVEWSKNHRNTRFLNLSKLFDVRRTKVFSHGIWPILALFWPEAWSWGPWLELPLALPASLSISRMAWRTGPRRVFWHILIRRIAKSHGHGTMCKIDEHRLTSNVSPGFFVQLDLNSGLSNSTGYALQQRSQITFFSSCLGSYPYIQPETDLMSSCKVIDTMKNVFQTFICSIRRVRETSSTPNILLHSKTEHIS